MRPSHFSQEFYSANRQKLKQQIDDNSLVLMQSADVMVKAGDATFVHKQDTNFYYYTGISYPDCSLLIVPNNDGKPEETLFIPSVDPLKEKWEGKMLTKAEALEISGIKSVQYNDTFLPTFYRYQHWRENLYCELNDIFPTQPLSAKHLLLSDISKRIPGLRFKKLHKLSTMHRIVKASEEIDRIKKAISLINLALRKVLGKLKPGMMEYQVEAEIMYQYLYNGCSGPGFDLIAAGGKNATCLHYTENKDELKSGELILIDTGGDYGMYSGDITRTFPINGKFTDRQKHCYQAVLDVQKTFMQEIKPGLTWGSLMKRSGEITGDIYLKYQLIEGVKKHSEVSYHGIGHFLGLDIHDVGKLDWELEPGAILTVEPGLYLPDEDLGIRIEDDILITESGFENLSANIPKEIEEIETIMS